MSETIVFVTGKSFATEVFSQLLSRRMGIKSVHLNSPRINGGQRLTPGDLRARINVSIGEKEGLIVDAGPMDGQFHKNLIWLLKLRRPQVVWFHLEGENEPQSGQMDYPILQTLSFTCVRLQPSSQSLESMLRIAKQYIESPVSSRAPKEPTDAGFPHKAPEHAPFHYRSRMGMN